MLLYWDKIERHSSMEVGERSELQLDAMVVTDCSKVCERIYFRRESTGLQAKR